ncbi:site-specific integrase [Gaoshiqia sediminis]|uniref:Site-specific integrase n=1 Tax=Gaoshiqia sediminis TaxID=2986998 RepID=A0AA41YBP6_9BACT|nr:site-specific integrase [Gaoshiqia sediminis]MCW0483145.1 site-specific integrase [Gaoshiqia sediminis]
MFNYANSGVTVSSILDDRRATKDNLFPVKIRVTFQRIRKYYSTGKYITSDGWEKLPNSKSKKMISMRLDIQNSFDVVKGIVQILLYDGGFSFEALNSRMTKSPSDTLNAGFKLKIQALLDNEQVGTHLFYLDALKSVESYGGENIPYMAVTVDWLKNYEKYMLKLGRAYTTIGMYCRAIRSVINEAKRAGIIKENQYPFGNGRYEIPTGTGRKLALTLQQIKSVANYTDGKETTEKYRDLWFFSYLCNGINFADMLTLKYSNIRNGEICFLRAKTSRTSKVKKEVCAILTLEMDVIIKRWGKKSPKPDDYIFGYLTGKETPFEEKDVIKAVTKLCNKRLKKIGITLGIESLSTYTARHSYATVLKRSGANIAYISESLGHNDLKTTENYLASFEKEERVKNASFLTNFG